MKKKASLKPYLTRLGIIFFISAFFIAAFNEGTHLLQRDSTDRPPKMIQLVVPVGTAKAIAAGQPVPSIPEEMVFVVGDTLEVKNEDTAVHTLGPLTIPPGTTASMVMGEANKYAYSCSFQPSQYLGLDIRQATTFATRLTAFLIATPPTMAILFLYSLVIFPVRSREESGPTGQAAARQG